MKKQRTLSILRIFSVFIFSFGIAHGALDDGLVAYYPFNGNANDASGNGNHGTVYGATQVTDRLGNSNSAYSFDGIDDKIVAIDTGNLNVGNELTVALWIKIPNPLPNRTVSFVSKSSASQNNGFIFPYYNYSCFDCFGLIVHTGGWDYQNSFTYSGINTPPIWHFYVGTFDGTARKVYLDGVLVSTDYQSGSITSNTNDLTIGTQPGIGEWANAVMDDIRIYNRALSESEIQALFSGGTVPPETDGSGMGQYDKGSYVGCFKRAPNSEVTNPLNDNLVYKPDEEGKYQYPGWCIEHCEGFSYAGWSGEYCGCGNEPDKWGKADDSECNWVCEGCNPQFSNNCDTGNKCGGHRLMSVYAAANVSGGNTPPTPTPTPMPTPTPTPPLTASCTYFNEDFSSTSGNLWSTLLGSWYIQDGKLNSDSFAELNLQETDFFAEDFFQIDVDVENVSSSHENAAFGFVQYSTGDVFFEVDNRTVSNMGVIVYPNLGSIMLLASDFYAQQWFLSEGVSIPASLKSIGLSYTQKAIILRINGQDTSHNYSGDFSYAYSLMNKLWLFSQASGTYVRFDNICAGSLGSLPPSAIPNTDSCPMPSGQQFFSYEAIAAPVMNCDSLKANPFAVGSVADGGSFFTPSIALSEFESPMDIYLGLYAPDLDLDNIFLIKPDESTTTLASEGPVAWKDNVQGEINTSLFGGIDIPISEIPAGQYYLYLLAAPHGSLNDFYMWETDFVSPEKSSPPQ